MSRINPENPGWDTYQSIAQDARHQDKADRMADLDAKDEAKR
jgi:hypothetical protein